MKIQSVAETLGQACKARPALTPVLRAFEPLLTKRREIAERFAPKLAVLAARLEACEPGEPVLAQNQPASIDPFLLEAAQELLPLLEIHAPMAERRDALRSFFLDADNQPLRLRLSAAILADDGAEIAALANESGLTAESLNFAASFIVSAVLRGIAANIARERFQSWQKGACPVCGKPPVIASLSKRPIAEPGEFLVPGGGQKYLHCDLCGTDWRFLRGVCPSCGTHGEAAMQILGEEERRHERIDWCAKCRSYLPCIDLREVAGLPDLDATALALMHLDLVAAEKELIPLKPSFWNMF